MAGGFGYIEYREILKVAYEARKAASPLYSYKALGDILGLDQGATFRVLNKERHLPARCVSRALDFLELSGREGEYFVLMTSYAREKDKTARRAILQKAIEFRDVQRRKMREDELSLLRDWLVVAICSAIEVLEGRAHPEEIASRIVPTIDLDEIRRSIQLLLDLGIARKGPGGNLRMVNQHLTIDGAEGRGAVAEFQTNIMRLASESVSRFPRELRDISTLTVTVDETAFQDVREILKDCRRRIQKRVGGIEHPDRVLQIALAMFPFVAPAERTP